MNTSIPPHNIGIILLAAGSSSRMGQSKQLLNIHGNSLLRHSVKIALASPVKNVLVVLGASEQDHSKNINDLPVQVVYNKDWQNGMGSSLKKGLTYLKQINPDCKATIVMVCDQPMISATHIEKLIQEHIAAKHAIVASFYQNTPGVPVLFPKNYFNGLLNVDDSQGAKRIIQQNISDTRLIDFPEGALDLDTMEDYELFISSLKN